MKIAVLMTCFNRVEKTLRCLQGLFAQALPEDCSFDVWLVDDGSTDGTGARVGEAFPQVHVVSGGELYWCKGMRLAWDRAAETHDYDAYLWLNDDVVLYPGGLKAAVEDSRQVGDNAVVVGTFATSAGSDEVFYGCGLEIGRPERAVPNGRPQRVRGYMTGNFVLVPRAVARKAGRIYDGFVHGVADTDYGLTLAEKGCELYVSSVMTGWCQPNRAASNAELRDMGFWSRMKLLWSPKGRNLHDAFLLKLRHRGLLVAVLSAMHIVWMVAFARSPHGK